MTIICITLQEVGRFCVQLHQLDVTKVSMFVTHVGVVPVTVRPPQSQNISTTLPTVHMIVQVSKAAAVLTTAFVLRLLRSKV